MDVKKLAFPDKGIVFWPVGSGESSTICVSKGVVVQIDIRHMEQAEEEDDPHVPIVDQLVESLPKIDGVPYLAVFALTHPDEDHCQGFEELLQRVHIGEIWFTPRVFAEFKKDLCDDAKAFQKEAMRRVRVNVKSPGTAESGDRIRIIGYDDLLKEDVFRGLPKDLLAIPGQIITSLDGVDCCKTFWAFVHSPFKDDADGDRNETSLGLQVTLLEGNHFVQALLFGDLSYPTLRKIFDRSRKAEVSWNILLAPHHCSKSAMYQDNGSGNEVLKQDIMDSLAAVMRSGGTVVSSSDPIPGSNQSGDNPPHAKAKHRYEEIAGQFVCTQEHPNEENPQPVMFQLTSSGLAYVQPVGKARAAVTAAAAVRAARGANEPPVERVGFGKRRA